MVDGRKLAGYAMRRRRGRILMQGTLQMSTPEKQNIALVCPVEEYEDHSISIDDLRQKLSAESIIERFALELETTFSIDVQYGMSDDIVLNTSLYLSNYENPELTPVRR
jgi:lipoate-protein ligase A